MMMREWIKEVARGQRGAKDLTYEQACQAAEMILTGQASAVQVGAFLTAERIKMETTDELHAFVQACVDRSLRRPIPGSLDCAGPYTGRSRTFAATLPAAYVLAACGVPVTLHASPALPPKMGVTLLDILHELGVPILDTPREKLLRAADEGLLFVPTEAWCPSLAGIRDYRTDLGVRTIFNTVEKLLRFSEAPYGAMGVFHGTVFEKVAELFHRLGIRRGLIIQGVEGSEDLTVEKRTRVIFVQNGEHETMVIDPEALGLQTPYPEEDWTVQTQASRVQQVLSGEGPPASPAYRNMVLLNSGVRLWLAEKADTVEQGVDRARAALDSGKAQQKWEQWKTAVTGR